MRAQPFASAATVALIGVLVATLIVPLAMAIGRAFVLEGRPSVHWFVRLFKDPTTLSELANGLALAATATCLSLLIGVPLAVLCTRARFRGQSILSVAALVPLILPPFVGAISMRRMLGQFGVLNLLLQRIGLQQLSPGELPPDWLASGFLGVAIVQALHLFPILYLNASAGLANVDPAYVQAARNMGCGPVRSFFRITLPLIRPGLFAGGAIVFIWSFTDIGTPLIMGYRRLPAVRVFQELVDANYSGKTYALVFLVLTVSVALYLLGKFVFGRPIPAASSKATVSVETRRLGLAGTAGAWAIFGVVLLAAFLPHLGVILEAVGERWIMTVLPKTYTLDHLRNVITDPATYRSILNSVKYAGASTFCDIVLGCAIAWLIVRARSVGSTVLDALAMLPLAVPGVVLAAGYVSMTAPGSLLESIGPSKNPFVILVIAYAVRRLPFVVRGASAGLQQVPVSLEESARNLGASRGRTFRRITLPLIAASLIGAGVLTFSFAMLEVSDSLILAQREVEYPITKQIYELNNSGTSDSISLAAAMGVYGMVLLGGTLAVASGLLGRRLGQIFRA